MGIAECIELASSGDFAKRQDALDEVLRNLAQESFQDKPQEEYGDFFHAVYGKYNGRSFRHQYASIYQVILSCVPRDGSVESYEIAEALVNNLGIIKNTLIDESDYDAKLGLFKLIDHVNLEAQRLVRDTAESSRQVDALRQELRRTQAEMQSMRRAQRSLRETIANQQRDYVTILSVFVAIIIAFGTGTGFAVSLTGAVIPKGSVALICFVVSVVGLVLFNALYALFEFLYRVVRKGRNNMPAGPWGIMRKRTFAIVNAIIIAVVLVFGALAYFNPMYSSPNVVAAGASVQQSGIAETASALDE